MIRYFMVFTVLFFSTQAFAISYKDMNTQIETFEKQGQSRFAPASTKRLHAYQGAALLAYEDTVKSGFNKSNSGADTALQNAISKTMETLNLASNNASEFTQNHALLLALEDEADKAYVYHHSPQMLAEEPVQKLYLAAKKQIDIAISSSEVGNLNQTNQAEKKALALLNQSIDASVPGLVEQTDRALSQAKSMSAKTYAPRTWQEAEDAFALLETYYENMQQEPTERKDLTRPKNIGYGLEMAVFAQTISIKAKEWQRNKSSFESLFLDERKQRLDLAKSLGLKLRYADVDVDIEPQIIISNVITLKQTLAKERLQHIAKIAALKLESESTNAKSLEEQNLKTQEAFQEKLQNIKSAFDSKLERETFEKKRQQKLSELFTSNEAVILPNLDGSLTIRAIKIQFGSNSSKIDGEYFNFLSRIKEALLLYPSRDIVIEGHTDSSGEAKSNRELSLNRAKSVLEYLISSGIESSRLRALGYGEVKPIATNMYKKGRAMNRRIDIIIQSPAQ